MEFIETENKVFYVDTSSYMKPKMSETVKKLKEKDNQIHIISDEIIKILNNKPYKYAKEVLQQVQFKLDNHSKVDFS